MPGAGTFAILAMIYMVSLRCFLFSAKAATLCSEKPSAGIVDFNSIIPGLRALVDLTNQGLGRRDRLNHLVFPLEYLSGVDGGVPPSAFFL